LSSLAAIKELKGNVKWNQKNYVSRGEPGRRNEGLSFRQKKCCLNDYLRGGGAGGYLEKV